MWKKSHKHLSWLSVRAPSAPLPCSPLLSLHFRAVNIHGCSSHFWPLVRYGIVLHGLPKKKQLDLSRQGRAFRSWEQSEPWQHSRYPSWGSCALNYRSTHWALCMQQPLPSAAILGNATVWQLAVCCCAPKLQKLLCTEVTGPFFSQLRNLRNFSYLLANSWYDYSVFMTSYYDLCSFFLRFSPFSSSCFIPLTDYQGLFSDHSYIFLHFTINLNI